MFADTLAICNRIAADDFALTLARPPPTHTRPAVADHAAAAFATHPHNAAIA
jgi:hypothetical protein